MHAVLKPANDARTAPEAEALLLARAAEGDARAFAELARLLARPALGLCIRVLGDRALAEDAVQEAMTRLWREAKRFDPARGSFAGWWRRMLMNCALDGRRRLKPVTALEEAAEIADAAPTPAGAAEAADLAARVQAAAAALPERQRAALALFHGEGLTMAEIAAALESSEKAVEGLLLRGRAALKDRLGDLKDELE
ncbi:sigma-70 family RNA polymerase sigma factor [Sandaracinobacter neustonicus]|uniref:Sigma-70 family RNA polymerase sigma factor n=1 Tax=Sandaracinobacter neustonicus TaxID=1715348 RepID=A0A501XGY5_9SPHN|nr:sigma-70 family RNA polymerase sigma factor [Sandaracinobacter neustonicus]TPE59810.1 sigma-70 family RNA polymerase sigma factor [Sandaracinobacter neustonicus]